MTILTVIVIVPLLVYGYLVLQTLNIIDNSKGLEETKYREYFGNSFLKSFIIPIVIYSYIFVYMIKCVKVNRFDYVKVLASIGASYPTALWAIHLAPKVFTKENSNVKLGLARNNLLISTVKYIEDKRT